MQFAGDKLKLQRFHNAYYPDEKIIRMLLLEMTNNSFHHLVLVSCLGVTESILYAVNR